MDGNGEGAKADFVLLIDERIAVAADRAQSEAELFNRGDGTGGVGDEGDLCEVLLQLLSREIGEQDAAHAGAVGGEATADVEVYGHNAADMGACNVDDVFAVERGDREGLAEGGGHALEDGLCGGGESVGRGVGVRQG